MYKVINLDITKQQFDFIENSNLEDFIIFAKKYNIFQESRSKIYDEYCTKIKARLDREGLAYDTVRPE